MKKEEMVEAIIEAKYTKGISWEEISKAAGMSDIFVISACLGQNTLPPEAAAKVASFLDLGNRAKDVEIALQIPPKKAQAAIHPRRWKTMPPTISGNRWKIISSFWRAGTASTAWSFPIVNRARYRFAPRRPRTRISSGLSTR